MTSYSASSACWHALIDNSVGTAFWGNHDRC